MKLKIWVKDEKRGITMGPTVRSWEKWQPWLELKESLQFEPFGRRYWAGGKVTKEQSLEVIGHCTFRVEFLD